VRIAWEERPPAAAEIPHGADRGGCGRPTYFAEVPRLFQERRGARPHDPHRDPGGAVMSYEYFTTHDYDDN
jgi:hypothetical protein